jgi:serine/threonine protein kinase
VSLGVGSRLGVFEVLGTLGAGGMGEVYRARDTKLRRDVALKILPESFASDADRLARFEREATTLAALNHPNIAQIYGLEESPSDDGGRAGVRALVMELVEGEDLARLLARRSLTWPDVIPIARQVAEALAAAHQAGIFALSTSTGEWRRITDFDGRATFIARTVSWSSDSRSIFAAVAEGDADIVRLDGLVNAGRD